MSEEREDRREVARRKTVPRGERGGVLVNRDGRNPAASVVSVVGAAQGERRVGSVEAASDDGAAHDEVVAAPAVVGADSARGRTRRRDSAPHVGEPEWSDAGA